MEEILIPIGDPKKEFEKFLNIENNSRLLFSGKFGIGKTHFINNFFDEHQETYEVFHLYPINYQISSNEDILELIKYDILVELLKKDEKIWQTRDEKGLKDSFLLLISFLKEKISINSFLKTAISGMELGSNFLPSPLSFLGILGKPVKDLLIFDKEFQDFKKEYQEGDKNFVEKYIKEIEQKITTATETDYLSQFLKEKILNLKGGKKSILILDDLDRMDPEHIFRILNIFSAFFEKEQKNKFGFDKIIIVADYTNIKSVFSHKYGESTDFSGYLDKFFTISPFYFDNKRAVMEMVETIVRKIKNEDPMWNDALGKNGYIKLFLCHIFDKAINEEIINLRELLKIAQFPLTEFSKGSYLEDPFSDNEFQKILDSAIKIAILAFSNTELFIKKLTILRDSKIINPPRAPLIVYIKSMLTTLGIKLPESDGNSIMWGDYKIIKNSQHRRGFIVDQNLEEKMFYDLLIYYISSKKFINVDGNNY